MRSLRVLTVLAAVLPGMVSPGNLSADFSYDSQAQITGGTLLQAVRAKEPPKSKGPKPVIFTHLIKGNRMAMVSKTHTTVVNLDNETILEIDFVKKTFLSSTFAKKKLVLDLAMKNGLALAKESGAAVEGPFQVFSKTTGRSKAFGFSTAREMIVTMTADASTPAPDKNPSSPSADSVARPVTRILVDSWTLAAPGFVEAETLRRKLAAKLGYAYAAGLFEIGTVKPELLPGFEELAKVSYDGDDMPVESLIRMGGVDSGELAPPEAATAAPKSGLLYGTLNRIENLRHKKTNGSSSAEEQETSVPGLLVEMTIELSNFSAGPAPESSFNPPVGFKDLNPPPPKPPPKAETPPPK